jgi:Tfp pilus assembly protein PilF
MASASELQALFARANAAFSRGDLEAAREAAQALIAQAPRVPQVRHLLALVEKKRGDSVAAREQFAAAIDLGPDDPQVHNNYANLLSDLGETALALDHYRRAVALKPDFTDALVNLAIVAEAEERYGEARSALRAATYYQPDLAKAWQMLGLLDRGEGDLDAAAAALDRAVALAPDDARTALGRARVEAERGGDAEPYFARAAALLPGDLELFIARNAADPSDPRRIEQRLAAKVAENPEWLDGHMALAQIRGQLGSAPPEASFEAVLAERPRARAVWFGLIGLHNRAERHADTLRAIARARTALAGDDDAAFVLDQLEAIAADEAGERERAAGLFARLPASDDVALQIARIRHALRRGAPDEAAAIAEPLTGSGSALAWAYLGTAWRLTGDPRHDWLVGDERLVQTLDIAEAMPPLETLAARLREFHVMRAHPLDQSLRGGTQTDGDILVRSEPLMRQVRKALGDAIDLYVSRLPPPDAAHPTLKEPRNGARIVGGWSVRLSAQGFHVNHVHPRGWLSSAFYVALPPGVGDAAHDGWLSLGVPPAELKLGLPPLRLVRPQPGRLALFPSIMWHGTLPFADGERLTIAFDVAPRRG